MADNLTDYPIGSQVRVEFDAELIERVTSDLARVEMKGPRGTKLTMLVPAEAID